jgi:DnaA-homolog protein
MGQCGTIAQFLNNKSGFYDESMAQQLILDILPPPEPTFDNFIEGENAGVIQATRLLAPGQALYIWGADGCGRSHLLSAAARFHDGLTIALNSAAQQLQALGDPETVAPPLIAIDDCHRLDAPAQAALFTLYNRWREQGGSQGAFRLLVAGDRAPGQMALREDLRTRLGWGAVFRLYPLSDEDKFAALMHVAKNQGMPLSEELIRWLLTHGSRDIRTLFAWLEALNRYALANHRAMTLPLLKSMLATQPLTPI